MHDRCYRPGTNGYHRYGGKGVTVCERWHVFEHFLADMGERPEETSLDRYPNSKGNYEPGNCRWATRTQQQTNVSTNRRLTHNGETLCVSQWSERLGMSSVTILARLKDGWSVERALTEPINASKRNRNAKPR